MCVPEYPEFSVSKMFTEFKDDKAISQYLHAYYEGQLPDQNFFYNFVCSLYPAEMYDIIEQAHNYRAVNAMTDSKRWLRLKREL